jgi:hypothetical protein
MPRPTVQTAMSAQERRRRSRVAAAVIAGGAAIAAACGRSPVAGGGASPPAPSSSSPPAPGVSLPPIPSPTASPGPAGRPAFASASAVWDPDHAELVLLGRVENGLSVSDQTWVWRAGGWQQLHPAHEPSPPREAVLLSDPATHQVFLRGGSYTPVEPASPPTPCGQFLCGSGAAAPVQFFSDTWLWTGSDWQQATVPEAPAGVVPASWVYAPGLGRLLAAFVGPSSLAGLYAWDGRSWTAEPGTSPGSSSGSFPGSFPGQVLAADPSTGQVVSYTGQQQRCIPDPCFAPLSRTWIGDGLSWQPVVGAEPEPAAGNLVSDPVDGGVLLLNEAGHTWVLRRGGWSEAATAGPDPALPGFLYTDGSGVFYQPEPGQAGPRWAWSGHAWAPVR